jgi:26S proteasome regulatory subunit N10
VISIGEVDLNQEKLEQFVKAVDKDSNRLNSFPDMLKCAMDTLNRLAVVLLPPTLPQTPNNEHSNLVSIPAGCVPSDALLSSPVVNEGAQGAAGALGAMPLGGGAMDDFGGVDPNMDPELAMALRVSMEEERARQEHNVPQDVPITSAPSDQPPQLVAPEPVVSDAPDEMDDEELLRQAMSLSLAVDQQSELAPASPIAPDPLDLEEFGEDMRLALEMTEAVAPTPSLGLTPSLGPSPETVVAGAAESPAPVFDSALLNSLLASLPGVDPSDPRIVLALQQIQAKQDEKTKKGNDEK